MLDVQGELHVRILEHDRARRFHVEPRLVVPESHADRAVGTVQWKGRQRAAAQRHDFLADGRHHRGQVGHLNRPQTAGELGLDELPFRPVIEDRGLRGGGLEVDDRGKIGRLIHQRLGRIDVAIDDEVAVLDHVSDLHRREFNGDRAAAAGQLPNPTDGAARGKDDLAFLKLTHMRARGIETPAHAIGAVALDGLVALLHEDDVRRVGDFRVALGGYTILSLQKG